MSGGSEEDGPARGLWDLMSRRQILPPPPCSSMALGESLSYSVSICKMGES